MLDCSKSLSHHSYAHFITHMQKEWMAIIVSDGRETAEWIDGDDIDMIGLILQFRALHLINVIGLRQWMHERYLVTLEQREPLFVNLLWQYIL